MTIKLLFLMLLLMMEGCYNLLEINDSVIAQNFSVDLLEDGKLAFYAQTTEPVARTETGESQPSRNITVMGTGNTAAEAARNMFLYFPRVFLWIHSNSIFIGEDLAREDLAYVSDFLIRNRNTRLQSYVFVTHDANVQQVLDLLNKGTFGSGSARCLPCQLEIQKEELGYYMPLQTAQFLEYLVTPGIEPAIPRLTIAKESGQERIKLQGMAVVKNNRVIGALNERESQGYSYLQTTNKGGGLVIVDKPAREAASVTMEISSFTSKTRPVIQEGQLSMRISIECELRYLEEAGTAGLYSREYKGRLENMASRQIEEQVQACITRAQMLNSDILGWGLTTARYQPGLWDKIGSDWDELFPDIQSRIEVKVSLSSDELSKTSFQFK